MFWIILIILLTGYISIRYFFSYNKDIEDLHGQTLAEKFNLIVKEINNAAFDRNGVVTSVDYREFNLYEEGKNQIVNFQYVTGHLNITWEYKYFQKEIIHKKQFDNVRNLSIFEQQNIGTRMVHEMAEIVESHKNKILRDDKNIFNSSNLEKGVSILNSSSVETYEEKARNKLYNDENYAGAIKDIDAGLQIDENNTSPDLYLLRAKCNYGLLNYEEALKDVNKSLSIKNEDKYYNYHMWDCLILRSQIYNNIGFLREGAMDWIESQKYFDKLDNNNNEDKEKGFQNEEGEFIEKEEYNLNSEMGIQIKNYDKYEEEVYSLENSIDKARFYIKKMKKSKKKSIKFLKENTIQVIKNSHTGSEQYVLPCRILKYYEYKTFENEIEDRPYKKALIEFISAKKEIKRVDAITYDLSHEEEIIYNMENEIPVVLIAEKAFDKKDRILLQFSHKCYIEKLVDNNDLIEDFIERKTGFINVIYNIIEEYAFQEGIRLIDKMIKVNKYRVDSEFYELRAECNEGLLHYKKAINDINQAIKMLSEHLPIDYKSYSNFLEIRSGFKKELEDFDGATEDLELAQSYQTKLS